MVSAAAEIKVHHSSKSLMVSAKHVSMHAKFGTSLDPQGHLVTSLSFVVVLVMFVGRHKPGQLVSTQLQLS